MKIILSRNVNKILIFASEEAVRTGWSEVTADHAVLGMIRVGECGAVSLLQSSFGVNLTDLKKNLESKINREHNDSYTSPDAISFSPGFKECFRRMIAESQGSESIECTTIHLLLAILKDNESIFSKLAGDMGIIPEKIRGIMKTEFPDIVGDNSEPPHQEEEGDPEEEYTEDGLSRQTSETSHGESSLMRFGKDLTKAAEEGLLDPVIGRDTQITRLEQILCRRKKNNPVLIGEPGVGKSALVEGLAQRLAKGAVPRPLLNKRIYSLDIASIVAGTKYRGQFEERIKEILNELRRRDDIILFIDELHTIVGAGGAPGSLDAANMLKPALARGEFQCIGSTTLNEYRQKIEKDGALERRFQKVLLEPSTFEETLDILKSITPLYEKHHDVFYTEEAVRACITLSDRYITDRSQPDKAIDILDEAGSRARLKSSEIPVGILSLRKERDTARTAKLEAVRSRNFILASELRQKELSIQKSMDTALSELDDRTSGAPVTVTEEDIFTVISSMTGIPINRTALSESNCLLSMEKILRGRIIGQDEAVANVVRAIRRNRAGIKDPDHPIGTFLFMGPTGVGKTYLAKQLAEFMFDSRESLIRIDMNEYSEKFASSRLIGAPPGYVGYDEGGQLTEQVRRHPYSVILLDEIEKAHPEIFNLLLQVLDEGRITDSNGRRIDFRNTILIMTSNVGSRELKDFGRSIGFSASASAISESSSRAIVEKALSRTFPPEFLNRIDEQIHFRSLDRKDINTIIDIQLKELETRISSTGYRLRITPAAKNFIAEQGYDPLFGARPLKRAIQKYVEDPVSNAVLSGHSTDNPLKIKLNKTKNNTTCE